MSTTDLARYLTDEVVEKAAFAIQLVISIQNEIYLKYMPEYEDLPDEHKQKRQHEARKALEAVLPDIIQQAKAEGEPLPVVNHKGPYDTDASMFRTMAERLRRDEPVGGSNARDALARLIDREISRADRIEQGGQP